MRVCVCVCVCVFGCVCVKVATHTELTGWRGDKKHTSPSHYCIVYVGFCHFLATPYPTIPYLTFYSDNFPATPYFAIPYLIFNSDPVTNTTTKLKVCELLKRGRKAAMHKEGKDTEKRGQIVMNLEHFITK